jgi:hypothetical protein
VPGYPNGGANTSPSARFHEYNQDDSSAQIPTAHKTTPSKGFPDMKITFAIHYDDEVFRFKAIKAADLDSAELESTGSLEQEWQALHDPRPEAKFELEFERRKENGFWLVRKRMFPENRKRKAEYF